MTASQLLLLGGASAPAVDPYFYSVTSLLHGDGTNGAQNNTFLDSSTNNFTITRNGNTTQGSFSPFSQTGWSNYFDGNGDYFTIPSNAAFAVPGAYTVEFWTYMTASPTNYASFFQVELSGGIQIGFDTTGGGTNFGVARNYVAWDLTTPSFARNQWVHVAVTRDGSNVTRIFYNGILQASATVTSSYGQGSLSFCYSGANNGYIQGYVSNFRYVKGTAVYTSNFTVPTTPLTAITNTQLLTCQSNRFIDNSTNNFTLTRFGDVSVQPFSPFNPTTAYSTGSVGGSGYFDGSGDYLTAAANAAFQPGTGDFSVEAWFNCETTAVAGLIGTNYTGTPPNTYIIATLNRDLAGNNIAGYVQGGVTDAAGGVISSSSAVFSNSAWNHFVFCRTGTTMSIFVNGSRVATGTNSTNITPNIQFEIGNTSTLNRPFKGYVSGARMIKGSHPYDATQTTITVPTAPLTAITNTSLLLNFTNAGIFDNAADADYETVGNAQISTSVKKYGTGSMYFDGTGDYLAAPFSRQWRIMGDDFTIEMWVYLSASQANMGLVSSYENNNGWIARLDTSSLVFFYGTGASGTTVSSSVSLSTGVWYHLAWCKIGSSLKAYVNGTQVGTTATISGAVDTTTAGLQVGRTHTVTNDFNGYIDDLRISKGVARYPYNFTPPTAEFPNIGGTVTLTADPYYDYTTLLLPGNGTNGAQNNTFLDSSTNNFTITRNGNTTQGTFSPFSQTGWGNYFDGTGDYLDAGSSTAFGLGTGDFTIEMWVYPTANPANGPGTLFDLRTGVTATATASRIDSSLNLLFYNGPGNTEITVGTVALNTWTQIAFVRSSGTLKTYVNGTQTNSSTVSGDLGTTQACWIAANRTAGYNFNGYISNFRIVKGTAVYTANFTPPTTPLTAVSGTSILTCQSNRFIDNSTNAFAITRNGDVSVQAFSPFNPTAAWSAATNGGSGYFDGSGDYLTCPDSTAFTMGSNDFSVECWYYPTSSSRQLIVSQSNAAGSTIAFWMEKNASNQLRLIATVGGTQFVATATDTIPLNAWAFLQMVRSGTTVYGYQNGVQVCSVSVGSSTLLDSSDVVDIGGGTVGLPVVGYISSVRILKGTASSATTPTAPLTAVTNTSLLLNFTNAGIYDATSKNDLETVGNAQISTTQSKFGGSSMLFDGSGDRLTIPFTSDLLELGVGGQNFTVEAWIYPTNTMASAGTLLSKGGGAASWSTSNGAQYQWGISSSALTWSFNSGGSSILVNNGTLTLNAWQHVAVTYDGTTTRTFLNGILQATSTSSYTAPTTRNLQYIGMTQSGGFTQEYYGYIDDFRITKGICRYFGNFTPPTTAFLTL